MAATKNLVTLNWEEVDLATLNWEEFDFTDVLFIMENLYKVYGQEKVNKAAKVAMAQVKKMSKESN